MTQPKAIATFTRVEEAKAFLIDLRATAAELMAVVTQETELVRASRIREAGPLERKKAEVAHRYAGLLATLRANAPFTKKAVPADLRLFQRENALLQAELDSNLAILATAHAVAEGIIRGAAAAASAKKAPAAYGGDGRSVNRTAYNPTPVAVSRVL
ncbi:MAG: hypothetical protein WCH83_10320 [Alphaproteobacteria bacterium]